MPKATATRRDAAPKKSESIELRLSHADKVAFMDYCRREERSASDVLRAHIASLATPPRRSGHWRVALASLVGLTLGFGIAAPSLAESRAPAQIDFAALDRNHDGVLTLAEYQVGR